MTSLAHRKNFHPAFEAPARDASAAHAPGVLRRLFDAVYESRRRQTDREIAHVLARNGWRLTDEFEREITRRLTTSDWRAH